jgi:ubiquinone/menaquinone biosynthesis C-methylase UbiE
MTEQAPEGEFPSLNQDNKNIWNTNADFWNERMAEGNDFHKILIEPNQLKLLDIKPDDLVLDIACGNGQFARKLADLNARVIATDFAPQMIANAKARTTQNTDRIEYKVVDATNAAELLSLGLSKFDAAVCTMAIMDMATIEPLISSLTRLLKPGGRFVFSVTHPCFNMTAPMMKRMVEQEEANGQLIERYWICVSDYVTPQVTMGLAMVGQPETQYYFQRPLNLLFNSFFKHAFVLDGIEEPVFNLPIRADRAFSWDNFQKIPPALIARMRLQQR